MPSSRRSAVPGRPSLATVTELPRRRPVEAAVPSVSAPYRRRRALAVMVLAGGLVVASRLVATIGAALVDSPATQLGAAPDVPVVVHDAEPGETLWSLAARLGPAGDVRTSLDQLIRLNGGSGLVAGQPVRVPASWYVQR